MLHIYILIETGLSIFLFCNKSLIGRIPTFLPNLSLEHLCSFLGHRLAPVPSKQLKRVCNTNLHSHSLTVRRA